MTSAFKNVWQLKLRQAHLRALSNLVGTRIAALEGEARNVMAHFDREDQEELDVLREIYEQLAEKS